MKIALLTCFAVCTIIFAKAQKSANIKEVSPPVPKRLKSTNQHINPIGPRYDWENNDGYCGETSLICAGLYYGQYVSQYDARALGSSPNNQVSGQLLLGEANIMTAAKAMRLDAEPYQTRDSRQFLIWVKQRVVKGYPVIIGVFNNVYYFYNDKRRNGGDTVFDHIVPVIGWGSNRPLNSNNIDNDVILFSDNGLYSPNPSDVPKKNVPYYFPYRIPYFMTNRAIANDSVHINIKTYQNRIYSLLKLPENEDPAKDKYNYALVVTGIKDPDHETLPVRLTVNKNYEAPAIDSASNKRPRAEQMTLTVTVSGLTVGQTYNLYHYVNETQVPVKSFNHNSPKSIKPLQFKATATTWVEQVAIKSCDKAFFRAVRADGN